MTDVEARMFIRGLTGDGKGFDSPTGVRWRDPCHIATDVFRQVAAGKLSREPIYDATGITGGTPAGVSLIEIYLTEPLPDIEWFYGIFTVDDFGIWYADQDIAINNVVVRQRVIRWQYIKGLVIHQRT